MTVVQPSQITANTAINVGCADADAVARDYTNPPDLPCATDPGWPGCNSPLVIDVLGNGFRFSTAAKGVLFDIDADGVLDQVGWTSKNSDDAWLAMDRNGNGVIDDGRELFGDVTPAFPGRNDITAPNGFEALKFLEASCYGFSLQDGVIDANDEAFGRLLLWNDRNHNGRSEPSELTAVTDSPLLAINTAYEIVERVRRGNVIRQTSTVRWASGTRRIVDVWLDTIQE